MLDSLTPDNPTWTDLGPCGMLVLDKQAIGTGSLKGTRRSCVTRPTTVFGEECTSRTARKPTRQLTNQTGRARLLLRERGDLGRGQHAVVDANLIDRADPRLRVVVPVPIDIWPLRVTVVDALNFCTPSK